MALNWSKDISFSGLRKAAPKPKETYPSKTYMNLAVADKKTLELRKVIPTAIILVLVVTLFTKFGVLDFIAKVNEKQSELATQQQTLSSLQSQLTNYDAVNEEHQAYVSTRLAADAASVSAIDATELVDSVIAPAATVISFDFKGTTLSLNLTNITLDSLGVLVSQLYEQPNVANVSVSTAATSQTAASDVTVAMVITMQRASE